MTTRHRIIVALLACAVHLAVFVPTVGSWSSVLVNDFAPQAEAIEAGDRPYLDQSIEYPPLSIPVLQGPALFGDGVDAYVEAFQWEMLAVDLALVLLLALGLPGSARQVISALGVYTIGLVMLSGVVLDDSLIDTAPLALSRFDLVPAALVLAAILARDRRRSATWSALLAAATAVKAFPLFLYPALMRGERQWRRAVVGGVIPLIVCVGIVIAWGDEFGAAITYHTGRGLQIESLAATPFEIAGQFGAGVSSEVASGGFDVAATGTDAARLVSVLVGAVLYLILLRAGWRSPVPNLALVTALLAVMVVFAPVLSPQFLLWVLPLSAAAYGAGRENLVLLVAILFTQIALQNYDQVDGLGAGFTWPIAARNLYLVLYLWLVCAPIIGGSRAAAQEPPAAAASTSTPKPA